MTSNAALQTVKRLFRARKAGHTGALDPLATGVLPIFFGEATKFCRFLLDADKHYLATVKLGVMTDTGDADGKVLHEASVPPGLTDAGLEEVLSAYRGQIEQIPPMYSALKVAGQRLYKLARKGVEVERKARRVFVHQLKLTAYQGDELTLDIRCSKGTYIRTLAEDIGTAIGCGAHVKALRRLGAGSFAVAEAVTIETLKCAEPMQPAADDFDRLDRHLLPTASVVKSWPAVRVADDTLSRLRQGQPMQVPEVSGVSGVPVKGRVGIFAASIEGEDAFVGVGEILPDGSLAPRRMIVSG